MNEKKDSKAGDESVNLHSGQAYIMSTKIETKRFDESEAPLELAPAKWIMKIEPVTKTPLSETVYAQVMLVSSQAERLRESSEKQNPLIGEKSALKTEKCRKKIELPQSPVPAKNYGENNVPLECVIVCYNIDSESADKSCGKRILRPRKTPTSVAVRTVETRSMSRVTKETPERRLAACNAAMKLRKMSETPEEREERLAVANAAMKIRLANETPKERKKRLTAANSAMKRRLANETPKERKERLAAANLGMRRRIANETPEEREERLAAANLAMRRRIANETPEEREKRLAAANLAMRRRIANETPEEREKRLAASRRSMERRLANETEEERKRRLEAARNAAQKRSQRLC